MKHLPRRTATPGLSTWLTKLVFIGMTAGAAAVAISFTWPSAEETAIGPSRIRRSEGLQTATNAPCINCHVAESKGEFGLPTPARRCPLAKSAFDDGKSFELARTLRILS